MNDNAIKTELATNVERALPADPAARAPRPWEMIEEGRYQPKRIKGSCVGRELG